MNGRTERRTSGGARTHPSLAVHEHTVFLVELRLNEGNGGDKVLKDVGRLGVVDVDLVADERLCCKMSGVAFAGLDSRESRKTEGPRTS